MLSISNKSPQMSEPTKNQALNKANTYHLDRSKATSNPFMNNAKADDYGSNVHNAYFNVVQEKDNFQSGSI